jgi:hypothetical protein
VNLLGKWKESEYGGGHSIPVGGIAYYITAPSRYVIQVFLFICFIIINLLILCLV